MDQEGRTGDAACPCGGGRAYIGCCGRWHDGPQRLQAPTAEALMRSRYAAYALGRADYLLDTWHPRTRPAALDLDPAVRWLGLRIERAAVDGSADAARAVVAFVARHRRGGGRAERLAEVSRFERVDGRWLYVDGDVAP